MKEKDPSQRSSVTFRCADCRATWKAEPGRIEDAPDRAHPWRYYASCPDCGKECGQVAWEQALLRGWASATGPKTEEGKRKAAQNLIGHPNASTRQRTRFNGIKHGLNAKVATYYPARPGHYPQCRTCKYLNDGCGEWKHGACLTQMELFFLHRVAFETRDPSLLNQLQADLQGNTQALINNLLLSILNTGVEIRAPQWYHDKDGEMRLATYVDQNGEVKTIEDISAHPLLKPLYELLSRNTDVLSKLGMTEKAKEEDETLQGFLSAKEQQTETLQAFAERSAQALESLQALIERSRERQKTDPVLIEQQQSDPDEKGEL